LHIVPHAIDLGLSPTKAALVLSTIGSVSIAGRMVFGLLIDKLGTRNAFVLCLTPLVICLVWLQTIINADLLYIFAVLYGFSHGGLFTVVSPTVAEYFGTRAHGAIFGLILFSGTLGGSAGPIVAGMIFDSSGSYSAAFITLAVLASIALLLAWSLKPHTQST
jgi:MFS family permease